MTKGNSDLVQPPDNSPEKNKDTYCKTEHGFTVIYGDREYGIVGISKSKTKLKSTIKGIKKEKDGSMLIQ